MADLDEYRHQNFCRIYYWKRNDKGHLCSASPTEEWDMIYVSPLSTQYSFGEQRIEVTEDQDRDAVMYKVRTLLSLLEQAYQAGQRAKLAEIQNTLGIERRR